MASMKVTTNRRSTKEDWEVDKDITDVHREEGDVEEKHILIPRGCIREEVGKLSKVSVKMSSGTPYSLIKIHAIEES